MKTQSRFPCAGLVVVTALAITALALPLPSIAASGSEPASTDTRPVEVLDPAYLNRIADTLRSRSPMLQAATALSEAGAAGVDAVRTWEDPMLMVGGMIANEEMRADDGDLLYGVQQKLPLFGRPAAARRLAEAQRDVAQADAEFRFQMLRRDLAKALFKAALADRVVRIGEQDLSWIESTLATVESRYQVGEGLQAGFLRMQNERARRHDQLITERRQQEQTRVVLNRLLGGTNAPAWPRFELPEPAGPVAFNESLVSVSTRYEPRLKVLRQMVTESDAMVGVARKMRLPEVSLGAEARHASRDGEFRQAMVTLSLSLPWFNAGRTRSEIRREEARRSAAHWETVDYELAIREELNQLVLAADAARREALLYRDEITPRSEKALASAEAAWIAGRAMFLEVLEARRMLLESRLMYARAIAEQYTMLSDLVLCCGLADLEALQMLGAEPGGQGRPKP